MKVAITDYTFPDLAVEESILQPLGHQIVAWKARRSAQELPELVHDADAVITQFAPIDASVIRSMEKARVIVRYGIGVDNVDLDAARDRRIPVCNVPDYCIDEVADHTLAQLLAITRQVVPNHNTLHAGAWGLASSLDQMLTLRDLTVGLVGFGRIGREVASRLRPFKCRLLAFDPLVDEATFTRFGVEGATLDHVFSSADVVSLHCPSTTATRRLVNRQNLERMRPGAILLNLSRGDLVDSAALLDALRSGRLAAAALDVFDPEPIPADHPILTLDRVVLSSHIASASAPAVRKLRETAASLAAASLAGQPLPNVVNGVV